MEATAFDWYLFRRESAALSITWRENGYASYRLELARGPIFWPGKARVDQTVTLLDVQPPAVSDPDCKTTRSSSLRQSGPPDSSGRFSIAGHESVYFAWSGDGRESTVAFAPALNCQLMLLREVTYSRIGVPIGIGEFRVNILRRALPHE